MLLRKSTTRTLWAIVISSFVASSLLAVSPTREVIEKWKADGVYAKNMQVWKTFRQHSGSAPEQRPVFSKDKYGDRLALGLSEVDTVRVLVIMVDFDDYPWWGQAAAGSPADFDSILFSDRRTDSIINPSGSMTDFYLENSYGKFYVQGDVFGWYRMPNNYSYYAADAFGLNPYIPNARLLANDAVTAAEGDTVNFARYDHDGDGFCDGVIIIHAGPGAEQTGDLTNIWSHKSVITNPRHIDGVYVYYYTMNPEEFGQDLSPIGVFCHEYGHVLGLPDLYDTDYNENSQGLGRWSLMASGNYNGMGKKPAHFDPWCKALVGFINLIDVTENIYRADIPQIESEPVAYRLHNVYSAPNEYWIVENRQKVGFDAGLPGEGLLIYHIAENVPDNTNPYMYKVALEQADGEDQLAFGDSRGDVGDPFPGYADNHNFHEFTNPNSNTYSRDKTRIGVWNISDSDSLMRADLDVSYSRPWIVLSGSDSLVFDDTPPSGNGDGQMDPGETIRFRFTIKNLMRLSYNVHASLSTDNPDIGFTTNGITIGGNLGSIEVTNATMPIEFTIPDTLAPRIDSFFLAITTDSVDGVAGSSNYTDTLAFEAVIGKPAILVVDDDRGEDYEEAYENAFYDKRIPSAVWHTDTQGTPPISELSMYDIVFWHTGDPDAAPSLDAGEVAAMKQYLDLNGNLCLSSLQAADDLHDLDSAFMAKYFKASLAGSNQYPIYDGVLGNVIGDGTQYMVSFQKYYATHTLGVVGEGEPAFTIQTGNICGITYDGPYKTVFLSFAIEFIDDSRYDTKATLISRVVEFFGGIVTSVSDREPLGQLPQSFDLRQNYPNPFNPTTTISYVLQAVDEPAVEPVKTTLSIYNLLGQKVAVLVDEVQLPGRYHVQWDATDSQAKKVASGIYFYRLERGNDSETRKMVLLK